MELERRYYFVRETGRDEGVEVDFPLPKGTDDARAELIAKRIGHVRSHLLGRPFSVHVRHEALLAGTEHCRNEEDLVADMKSSLIEAHHKVLARTGIAPRSREHIMLSTLDLCGEAHELGLEMEPAKHTLEAVDVALCCLWLRDCHGDPGIFGADGVCSQDEDLIDGRRTAMQTGAELANLTKKMVRDNHPSWQFGPVTDMLKAAECHATRIVLLPRATFWAIAMWKFQDVADRKLPGLKLRSVR